MSEYPEALIEKVAWAISYAEEEPGMVAFYRNVAVATLDAIGLREERRGPQFYKDSSSRRFVTEWEEL
jgi:hypothetical protein